LTKGENPLKLFVKNPQNQLICKELNCREIKVSYLCTVTCYFTREYKKKYKVISMENAQIRQIAG
jgi:hypothetical protein